jgi:general L-amino acid transport system permease protein
VRAYVEFIRNTPLLVQLFFIYFGVVLTMPSLQDRIEFGPITLSQRGVWVPRPVPQGGFLLWLEVILVALTFSVLIYARLDRRRRITGEDAHALRWAMVPLIGLPLVSWLLLPSPPLAFEAPVLEGLRMVGGLRLTPEYFAILLGLVLYTGAFITDIVRRPAGHPPRPAGNAARSPVCRKAPCCDWSSCRRRWRHHSLR